MGSKPTRVAITALLSRANIKKKEEKELIRVSREEAKKLRELGVKDGENGLSRTQNHHSRHYYLCESEHNLRCLLKFSLNEKAEKLLKAIEERKKNKK